MLPIKRSRRACADADEIVLYLLDQGAFDAADRFGVALDETVEFLSEFPDVGDLLPQPPGSKAVVRIFPVRDFPKYLVYLNRGRERGTIMRILHGSRQIDPSLFPELPS